MSAFARLALITKKSLPAPESEADGVPISKMERTALEAARNAAQPLPAPTISFSGKNDAPSAFRSRRLAGIRAAISS
jgi:hypothetical protein